MRNDNRGMTFIELNIVVVLFAVICLTIYGSFSAGMRIWERAKKSSPECDAHIFLDKISSDIRNTVGFSPIIPHGSGSALSFAVFQPVSAAVAGNGVAALSSAGIGRVAYNFDAQQGILYRSYRDFRQEAAGAPESRPRPILNNLKSLSFAYCYLSREGNEWTNIWEGQPPLAVKIELLFVVNNRPVTMSKTVSLQAGN